MSEDIKKNIMQIIKKGEVKMHAKAYFIASSALKIVGAVAAFIFAVFLLSFILFYLQYTGAFFLPGFGLGGVRDLLLSLPWVIIGLIFIFIALLVWFTERYPLTYRNPLLYSLLGVVCVVAVTGVVVAKTPLHQYFYRVYGHDDQGGVMGRMYGMPPGSPLHNGLAGRVTEVDDEQFILSGPRDSHFQVYLDDDTQMIPDMVIQVGDFVLVQGEINGATIHAIGVRDIPQRFDDDWR